MDKRKDGSEGRAGVADGFPTGGSCYGGSCGRGKGGVDFSRSGDFIGVASNLQGIP